MTHEHIIGLTSTSPIYTRTDVSVAMSLTDSWEQVTIKREDGALSPSMYA